MAATEIFGRRDLTYSAWHRTDSIKRFLGGDKKVASTLMAQDIDFCEYQGRLVINYSWGNQQGVEFLAEAAFDGTLDQFLTGWFPEAQK